MIECGIGFWTIKKNISKLLVDYILKDGHMSY